MWHIYRNDTFAVFVQRTFGGAFNQRRFFAIDNRNGLTLLLDEALNIGLIDLEGAQTDALERDDVAAARMETWNMDKTRAKREQVANGQIWAEHAKTQPKHVKLVHEWKWMVTSANFFCGLVWFEIQQ